MKSVSPAPAQNPLPRIIGHPVAQADIRMGADFDIEAGSRVGEAAGYSTFPEALKAAQTVSEGTQGAAMVFQPEANAKFYTYRLALDATGPVGLLLRQTRTAEFDLAGANVRGINFTVNRPYWNPDSPFDDSRREPIPEVRALVDGQVVFSNPMPNN